MTLRGAVLARFLADQAQDGERQRLDAADAAHAVAARADDGGSIRRATGAGAGATSRAGRSARCVPIWMRARSCFTASRSRSSTVALVLRRLHVDEVDDDQAADVAQAQLAGDFVGGFEVGVEAVVSMSAPRVAARRVDVDRHQRLGVVDHDAAARGQRHLVRVRRLDLALDLVAREQRDVVVVELELAQVAAA